MKRIKALISALLIMLLFCSCSEKDNKDAVKNTSVSETEIPAISELNKAVSEIQQNGESSLAETEEISPLAEDGHELPIRLIYSGESLYTSLILKGDNSFEGEYYNAGMDPIASSDFFGSYTLEAVNEYSYRLILSEFEYTEAIGETWSDGTIDYISIAPDAIGSGDELVLYTTEAPIAELPEEFFLCTDKSFGSVTFDCYAVYNVSESSVFFSY